MGAGSRERGKGLSVASVKAPGGTGSGAWDRLWIPVAAAVFSGLLYAVAFPPVDLGEGAYIFAIPYILWAFRRPGWRPFLVSALVSQWGCWAFLLVWLRHVPEAAGMAGAAGLGWILVLTVSGIVSLFGTGWLASLRWGIPRWMGRPAAERVLGCLALAGFWVVLEWVRTWFIFGFPWLPLAASQWKNPVILQPAAWTGAYGVSFLLILLNLGTGAYLWKIFSQKKVARWTERLCPEFYVALGGLLAVILIFFETIPQPGQMLPMFRAGVVQPNIPQTYKWKEGEAARNLAILERQSILVNALDPDVLLWPESATPLPVLGATNLREWTEAFANELGTPILMGNLARELDADGNVAWYNGIFFVDPETGLDAAYYKKRKLVPFGEYVPLRRWFPFVGKFVPLEGDFSPGRDATVIEAEIGPKGWKIGGLVCYEDVFPGLVRSLAREGVEVFFVATNNSWYGEEAGAYQHAAHSVLRAVETRRPFLRCGNNGWSGYIDERGHIRHEVADARGSIYFQGGAVLDVTRDRIYSRAPGFYARYGDWFVWLSVALVGAGILCFGKSPEYEPPAPDPDLLPQVGRTIRRRRS